MDNIVDNTFKRAGENTFGDMIPGRKEYRDLAAEWTSEERHHLHVYAHKHNTHITLTRPNRDPMISLSCGNIGFKKAGRGTYDSAYQLAAFVMARIQDKGFLVDHGEEKGIKEIELVYRGFGPGREAVTKAILGSEGKNIRPLITRLSDSTRLKFGGTRSKKPRRLG
ncbi:translational machinery component [Byssothecium circinans]|uniref:Translational machinery component n=1 Tax=Byssothecium circinans TaxID=147558 RepID=A0A6A5TKG9_9PLEO|nr:translational machinery component [Byssothecium circinans]